MAERKVTGINDSVVKLVRNGTGNRSLNTPPRARARNPFLITKPL